MLTGSSSPPSGASRSAPVSSARTLGATVSEDGERDITAPGRREEAARLGSRLDALHGRLSALSPFRDSCVLAVELEEMRRRIAAIARDPSRNTGR